MPDCDCRHSSETVRKETKHMEQKMRIWQTDTAKVGEHGGRCNGWIDWQKDMGKKAGRRKDREVMGDVARKVLTLLS